VVSFFFIFGITNLQDLFFGALAQIRLGKIFCGT
jgi:hypothetical protein